MIYLMEDEKNKLKKIKSGFFSRGFELAKLTINTSQNLALAKISSIGSNQSDKEKIFNAFLESQAGKIAKELGQLKGSAQKAGQMLSVYGESFLPPQVNRVLKTLQNQSSYLDWKVIEQVLISELGPEKLSELIIETHPIGSASIGQVHKAIVKATGKELALKIQYPGVEKAIDSDLYALKTLFNFMKIIPNHDLLDSLFVEVKSMMKQETNYSFEADMTKQYSTRLEGDSRYVIPKIYDEYSTGKILAMSFENGLRPDDALVMQLSHDRRAQIGLNFIDLYFRELFDWGVVQTDPHLGNYKIRLDPDGNDQIVLFDFGATQQFEARFLETYHRLIKSAFENKIEILDECILKIGFTSPDDSDNRKVTLRNFCLLILEPFQGEFDWAKSDLPQRVSKLALNFIIDQQAKPPPKEIIFLDRKTLGTYSFCSALKVKMNARPLLEGYLAKIGV